MQSRISLEGITCVTGPCSNTWVFERKSCCRIIAAALPQPDVALTPDSQNLLQTSSMSLLRNFSSLTEIPKTFVGDAKFSSYFDACERAEAKGEARGRAEGAAESKREVAAKMKADGLDPAMIAKYSGLTVEEVEAL